MNIFSSAFAEGGVIPEKYTCRGDGNNPPLEIRETPGDAVCLALIVDDPDAPFGDFVHWVMWNIGRETMRIDEGVPPPEATQGRNSAGTNEYVAPCPPSGTHRYQFKLYALDKDLELFEMAGKKELETEIRGHIVAEAVLTGLVSS